MIYSVSLVFIKYITNQLFNQTHGLRPAPFGTMGRLQLLWHQADRAALPLEGTLVGPPEASPTCF